VGKIGEFEPIRRRISETVYDMAKDYYIASPIMPFRLVPKSTTLDDLQWPYPHSTAQIMHFSELITKIFQEDRPILYQQQKSSPGTLLSGGMRLLLIFVGVPWKMALNDCRVVRTGDFS